MKENRFLHRQFVFRQGLVNKSVNIRRLRTPGYPGNRHQAYKNLLQNPTKSVGTPTSTRILVFHQPRREKIPQYCHENFDWRSPKTHFQKRKKFAWGRVWLVTAGKISYVTKFILNDVFFLKMHLTQQPSQQFLETQHYFVTVLCFWTAKQTPVLKLIIISTLMASLLVTAPQVCLVSQ